MKKAFLLLAVLIGGAVWAQTSFSLYGQVNVVDTKMTWGSDSAIQVRYLSGQVHRDTSPSDTAQHWKRQDNTADSCTNPVYLGRTVNGIWKFAWREMAYSRDPDSSAIVYKWEVRWPRNQRRGDTAWTPWVKAKRSLGTVNDPVQDTVAMPTMAVASAVWGARYELFNLPDGVQARACPDIIAGRTGGQTTDTLITKNHRLIVR